MELQKNPCDHWTLTHRTSKEAPGKKIWWGKSYKCVSINISPFACLPSSEDQSSIFCAPKLFITTETLGTERKVNACGDPKWFTWELAGERVCWERKKKKAFGVWCSGCWDTLGQEERMWHPWQSGGKVERREKQTVGNAPTDILRERSGKTGKNLNWIGDAVLAETGLCGAWELLM